MLSERTRRALLRDISDAAKRLLDGLGVGDEAVIAEALASAEVCRADMTEDYRCPMRECFDQIETAMKTAAARRTDTDRRMLRGAVMGAGGHLVGALATGTRSRVTELGGGVREVLAGDPLRIVYEVESKVLCDRFGAQLVAQLMRVLAGGNRLAALLHFVRLDHHHVRDHSVADQRNFIFANLIEPPPLP